jgi:general secretion pathway protein C
VLALVLLFVAVKTVMNSQQPKRIVGPATAVGTENIVQVSQTNPDDVSADDYSVIVQRNIFGTGESSRRQGGGFFGDGATSQALSAEEELGLLLLGTVSGSPTVARAVVKQANGGVIGVHRTGDKVAGASIESIEKDVVFLKYNGRRMVLRRRTGWSGGSEDAVGEAVLPHAEDSATARRSLSVRQIPLDTTAGTGPIETLLGKAVIVPHVVNGQTAGLRLTGLKDIPVAKDLGLREGDVITVVNGQQLTSKQKAFQILKKARARPTVSIELLRGNRTERMSFGLR